jgi:dTDP-4-amino-4,6-dideoxygalactose transaminase
VQVVPFMNVHRQYDEIREEIQSAICSVLDSAWFILGRNVMAFEEEFAAYCEARYGIGVGSGTEALHLALLACGVGPGDEVITVANTFIATALAIDYTGAKPIFVDIDPASYTLDVAQIEKKISPRTKAILPVHLFGQPADMRPIMALAEQHGFWMLEDACQAHGAEYEGRKVGALGHIACFSFYPSKNLGAYGDGGLIVTNDYDLAERARLLRNYGQVQKYYHQCKGFNSRLDEMQAAVLRVKLGYLDRWNEARRRIAHLYSQHIESPYVLCPVEGQWGHHVYHLYVIRSRYRDQLHQWLTGKGIETLIHYPVPIHLQQAYQNAGSVLGSLPITEQCCDEVLSLPMFPELTDKEIQWVIQAVNEFHP